MKARGSGLIEVVVLLAALGAVGGLAGWKPFERFKKGPPIEQVSKLQEKLDAAESDLARAKAEADALRAAEQERKNDQLRYAQQMTGGANAALKKVVTPSAEVVLASDLLRRSEFALGLAIGELPTAMRAEILQIVDQALSSVQAERDEARAALQARDRDLKNITQERNELATQVVAKEREAQSIASERAKVQAELERKQAAVNVWAKTAREKELEAGSLSASFERLLYVAALLVAGYLFVAFILPGIVKAMRPGKVKNFLRDVSGYTTSPLLYADAKHKIEDLKSP